MTLPRYMAVVATCYVAAFGVIFAYLDEAPAVPTYEAIGVTVLAGVLCRCLVR